MPIYDYACPEHGTFELSRPMSQCGLPADCPDCGAEATRVITAPRLRALAPMTRNAMERNERSRHAPHVCGSGCGHGGPPSSRAKEPTSAKPKLTAYKGPRPWVVEHR